MTSSDAFLTVNFGASILHSWWMLPITVPGGDVTSILWKSKYFTILIFITNHVSISSFLFHFRYIKRKIGSKCNIGGIKFDLIPFLSIQNLAQILLIAVKKKKVQREMNQELRIWQIYMIMLENNNLWKEKVGYTTKSWYTTLVSEKGQAHFSLYKNPEISS